jgi:hypothetical protein
MDCFSDVGSANFYSREARELVQIVDLDVQDTLELVERLDTAAGIELDDFLTEIVRRLTIRYAARFPNGEEYDEDELRDLAHEVLEELVAEGQFEMTDKELEAHLPQFFAWTIDPSVEKP